MSFHDLPKWSSLTWVNGGPASLTSGPLRVCLLFQVNCPGCHTHAIPVANQLAETYPTYLISTAFEDFELNTLDNTRLLMQGKRIGVPKRAIGEQADESSIPRVPVAWDIFHSNDNVALCQQALLATKENAKDHFRQQVGGILPPSLERQIDIAVTRDQLPDQLAASFYSVRAKGTPTWIAQDENGQTIDVMFGNYNLSDLKDWVRRLADKLAAERNLE